MRNEQVTCDHCGFDLTTTGNSVDYRLTLMSERLPFKGSICTDMMLYPPVRQTRHFCGIPCLRGWLEAGGEK